MASSRPPRPGPDARRRPAAIRRHLERCLRRECNIDPLILRIRRLRRRFPGQARCLEQELLPIL